MDPQQRLLLETAYRALENGGSWTQNRPESILTSEQLEFLSKKHLAPTHQFIRVRSVMTTN